MIPDTASLWSAARRFEGILRNDPGAYSFAPLSGIYLKLGLLEDALETARTGTTRHPEFAAGQLALAHAALASGFEADALKALAVVVRVTPENLEAQRLLAGLYESSGDSAAAARCLALVASLDADFQVGAGEEPAPEEEILEADILELADECIEDEIIADTPDPFMAVPDRPSLGENFIRPEPYLMEIPPPGPPEVPVVQAVEELQPAQEVPVFQEESAPVMASATIAELYVSQGFIDKGIAVYRELLGADPANESYLKRIIELMPSPEPPVAGQGASLAGTVLDRLNEWLVNIGRVREWRTRSL